MRRKFFEIYTSPTDEIYGAPMWVGGSIFGSAYNPEDLPEIGYNFRIAFTRQQQRVIWYLGGVSLLVDRCHFIDVETPREIICELFESEDNK